jgi:hypothetical protein
MADDHRTGRIGQDDLAEQIFAQARLINPGRAGIWMGPKRRPQCVWMPETRFADAIMTDSGYPKYLADDYLVVLDDLASARERWDRVSAAIFDLANVRLGKWMIWTSNLNIREISAALGERVASRLQRDGNRGVRISAPDYALRNKPESTGGTTT